MTGASTKDIDLSNVATSFNLEESTLLQVDAKNLLSTSLVYMSIRLIRIIVAINILIIDTKTS